MRIFIDAPDRNKPRRLPFIGQPRSGRGRWLRQQEAT